jgi:hypothetical protein
MDLTKFTPERKKKEKRTKFSVILKLSCDIKEKQETKILKNKE